MSNLKSVWIVTSLIDNFLNIFQKRGQKAKRKKSDVSDDDDDDDEDDEDEDVEIPSKKDRSNLKRAGKTQPEQQPKKKKQDAVYRSVRR